MKKIWTSNPQRTAFIVFGAIVSFYVGLAIAPVMHDGLQGLILNYDSINWMNIKITKDSLKYAMLMELVFVTGYLLYISQPHKFRRGREHGSAEWGNVKAINSKISDKDELNNKIMTQNLKLSMNTRVHMLNLNTLVIGGSGAGKTRFYALPNIMQCDSSYVILDPKGEIVSSVGELLKENGYEIIVLDLKDMKHSHGYNPFDYMYNIDGEIDENQVQKLVTAFMKSTNPKGGSSGGDPFWDTAAEMLLKAIIFYILEYCPPQEQNFGMVMEMLRNASSENDVSPLDIMFEELETKCKDEKRDDIALKYYKNYHSGAQKTLQSIQITLSARLEKFNLEEVVTLTKYDEMNLLNIGKRKIALFAVIPVGDTSYNFLVSMLYTQLFQSLMEVADKQYGGKLPVPVQFIMDEFANVALPDDFDKITAFVRSYGIYLSIILQSISQLKALYDKTYGTIMDNCDQTLYLGGNSQDMFEYVSKRLGKETIDTNTYGESKGKSGSFSKNSQNAGRELMTIDEVSKLDNKKAILFIRGECPIIDNKYDIMKHPNINKTTNGKGNTKPYRYWMDSSETTTIKTIRFSKVDSLKILREYENNKNKENQNQESEGK